MDLDGKNHSVFSMYYHLILVIKYRRAVLDEPVSKRSKEIFESIRQKLWKEYFWSRSYWLLTTGGAPIEVVKRYIESQGEKI